MPVFAPLLSLSNGYQIPAIGIGTFKATGFDVVRKAISAALDAGYRHIDTAFIYANEADIGVALKEKMTESGIAREDMFITTKLWNTDHNPRDVMPACKASLERLQLDYIDLYLIHWPVSLPREGEPLGNCSLEDTWRAMEKLVEAGKVRSLGLSNFNSSQIDRIFKIATFKPTVLQIEASIVFLNDKLIKYAKSRGLQVVGYAPFGSPANSPEYSNPLEIPCVVEIAKRHNKSPGQVLIRHAIERGLISIPKSITPERIQENIDVFDFQLSENEMSLLNTAEPNQYRRFGLKAWSQLPEYPFDAEF